MCPLRLALTSAADAAMAVFGVMVVVAAGETLEARTDGTCCRTRNTRSIRKVMYS